MLFTRNNGLTVGELDGAVSDRVRRIVDALGGGGIRADASDGIVAAEWTKFAAWVGLMVLSVTTRRNTWEFLCHPGAARVLVRIVREVGQLAGASGVQLVGAPVLPIPQLCEVTEEQAVEIVMAVGRGLRENAPTHRVSTLQALSDAGLGKLGPWSPHGSAIPACRRRFWTTHGLLGVVAALAERVED